jgi:lipoprotein-anchoring transpeptidase ErfK/SrfK
MLAERFHASPALLRRLNPRTPIAAGRTITVPNTHPLVPPRGNGRRREADAAGAQASEVVVAKDTNDLVALDANGAVIFYAPVSSGSQHDPLPIGDWTVRGVYQNPRFFYNPDLFWDAEPSRTKAQIAPGPNNPVGFIWIDLDRPHYGLHGTPEPSMVGVTQSHGCVRLTNWDAITLAAMVREGTRVSFRPTLPEPAERTASMRNVSTAADNDDDHVLHELRERHLLVPVSGVRVDQLVESFQQGRGDHTHEALDILAPRGTPVLAVDNGTIAKLFLSKPGGNTIYQFDKSERFAYYYAHLDRYADGLKEGQKVRRGDTIGYVGSTGNADAKSPHLHFGIFMLTSAKQWWKGTAIDPYPVFRQPEGKQSARRSASP